MSLVCRDDNKRRAATRAQPLFGVDYVEVDLPRKRLHVYFLGRAPSQLESASVVVEGGVRIVDVHVRAIDFVRSEDPGLDDVMTVSLSRLGDASAYRLRVAALDPEGRPTDAPPDDFDPRYAAASFSFGLDCNPDLDCGQVDPCPEPVLPSPAIDYLAKDYASFRRLMLDRIRLLIPDWRGRLAPDLGVTLVEAIAAEADRLSYFQDAAGTEAYLETARLRTSVRRHLRLMDYTLHEGCNARAWIAFTTSQDIPLARGTFFAATRAGRREETPGALALTSFTDRRTDDVRVFEPVWPDGRDALLLRKHKNAIRLYTYRGAECCLPKGSLRATLLDPGTFPTPPADEPDDCHDDDERSGDPAPPTTRAPTAEELAAAYALDLSACDVLIFEEVKGPKTGLAADADPAHRHAVRLTSAVRTLDPVPDPSTGLPVLLWEVTWHRQDALPFPVCISAMADPPLCAPLSDVTIVRGNVMLFDHGETRVEALGQVPLDHQQDRCESHCAGASTTRKPGSYRPCPDALDLTHAEPMDPCRRPHDACGDDRFVSASALMRRDPRAARAAIALTSIPPAPNGEPAFARDDLAAPESLARAIATADTTPRPLTPPAYVRALLPRGMRRAIKAWALDDESPLLPEPLRTQLTSALSALQSTWRERRDLLSSTGVDRHFVVEMSDERRPCLRFGDGHSGALPAACASFYSEHRVGNGPAGNVGADGIDQLIFRDTPPSGVTLRVRNPLGARGGTAPETVAEAKRRGPYDAGKFLLRAITPLDYATIVQRDFADEVQRAGATQRWNGHMPEILIAVDALASAACSPDLLCRIERHLERFRRIGHAVKVVAATPVPLRIGLCIKVLPGYAVGQLRAAVLARLGSKRLADGHLGFFHEDRMLLGQPVHASALIAEVQALPGVAYLRLRALERYWDGPAGELDAGVLRLGPLEVAQLDSDPTRPERGVLELEMDGGR